MRNFANNPRYQRAVQKLRRLDPRQSAILDSAFIDKEFARSEMGKTLKGMQLSITRKGQAFQESMGKRRLDIKEKDWKGRKKDARTATLLGGANVAMSGYFGQKENERLNRLAAMIKKQRGLY